MVSFKKYIACLVVGFLTVGVFSQSKNENLNFSNAKENSFYAKLVTSNNLNSLVDVEQVQNYNVVNLSQYGLNNVSEISQESLSNQKVYQLGKDNYYSFNDFYSSGLSVKMHVLQQGSSNSLQIYGTNSMMDGIQVLQRANNQNIIIKNYK